MNPMDHAPSWSQSTEAERYVLACRHNFYPYFEGNVRIYSPEMLKEWDDPEYYADTQRQRTLERTIRKTKGELAAYDAATKNGIDMRDDFNKASMKLKRQERELKAFINGKDLKREREREQVFGFGRSTAQKAVWVEKRAEKGYNKVVEDMRESIYAKDGIKDIELIQRHIFEKGKT